MEIIKAASVRWIGFKHFALSVVFAIITLILGTFLALSSEPFSHIFGFYFSSPSQEIATMFVTTLIGVSAASFVERRQINKFEVNARNVLKISLRWFTSANLLLWFILLAQGPHYGMSGMDQLASQVPLSLLSILLFYFITRLIFSR